MQEEVEIDLIEVEEAVRSRQDQDVEDRLVIDQVEDQDLIQNLKVEMVKPTCSEPREPPI